MTFDTPSLRADEDHSSTAHLTHDLTRFSGRDVPMPLTADVTDRDCERCGILAHYLPVIGVWIHAEPRTLANNLHNGTPDHNAVVTS